MLAVVTRVVISIDVKVCVWYVDLESFKYIPKRSILRS